MKLNLSVEGRILASVAVEAEQAQNEYYLKALRRLLILRHQQKLAGIKHQVTFILEKPQVNRDKVFTAIA